MACHLRALFACLGASLANLLLAAYTLFNLVDESGANFVVFAVTEQAMLLAMCVLLGGAAHSVSPMQTKQALVMSGGLTKAGANDLAISKSTQPPLPPASQPSAEAQHRELCLSNVLV